MAIAHFCIHLLKDIGLLLLLTIMETVAISICKKKKTETSIRVRGPQGGALISYNDSRAKEEEGGFFPCKDSANEKP